MTPLGSRKIEAEELAEIQSDAAKVSKNSKVNNPVMPPIQVSH